MMHTTFKLHVALGALAIAGYLGSAPTAPAHGDVHEQLDALNKEIEKDPRNPELYLRRGELQREHPDLDAALADFEYAAILNPKLSIVDFHRARFFVAHQWPITAKVTLDRFLSVQSNHVEGLVLRARVLMQLGQRLDAVKDYTRAIGLVRESRPELFLERAQALMDSGESHYAQALEGIEEGIKKLGPLVTLQLQAIDIEVKQKRIDAALERLDKAAEKFPRKETWLERKGDILRDAGRPDEARAAYKAALEALEQVPPARRYVPAMQELEKKLRTALGMEATGGAEKPAPPAVR